MITVNIKDGHHDWQKQNLITIFKGKRHFDILKCSKCGIEGKTTSVSTIALKSSYNKEKIKRCPAYKQQPLDEKLSRKYYVANSPWPDRLPVGTEIIPIEKEDYYKRADGKLLFEEEKHGTFKLYGNEIEIK